LDASAVSHEDVGESGALRVDSEQAEHVRRRKRELVLQKNAERVRALELQQRVRLLCASSFVSSGDLSQSCILLRCRLLQSTVMPLVLLLLVLLLTL
jgi:hypothetical protein